MILYFSGTGNSKFVAERIAEVTNEKIISINKILKEKKTVTLQSDEPYVFVLPVYAGRMPRVVERCIEEMNLNGSNQAYFIMTCFETPYQSEKYIQKLCCRKHLKLVGFDYVQMPQSYIAMYDVPEYEEAVASYQRAIPVIEKIAGAIQKQQEFEHKVNGGGMMSNIINPIFYPLMVTTKGFHVNEKCKGCGKCETLCPLNNISLIKHRPEWGKNCTHCMACINGCPETAIEYKKSTVGKSRNYNIGTKI